MLLIFYLLLLSLFRPHGTTRTAAKAELIKRMGAEPAIADGLDAPAIRAAVIAAKPDIIIDQMTDLADVTDLRHFDRAFATTNRLRTEGTDFLLAAAREAGVKRFIAQSFCGWTYGRGGEAIKTEADALDPDPPEELHRHAASDPASGGRRHRLGNP